MLAAQYIDLVLGVGEIFLALSLFRLKDMLHIGIAIALFFFFNSLLFVVGSQPLLAVLQLIVAIGGISTYFIVGVAAMGYSKFRYTRFGLLAVSSLLVFILAYYFVSGSFGQNISSNSPIGLSEAGVQVAQYAPMFYVLLALLFGVGLGSVLLFEKLRDKR